MKISISELMLLISKNEKDIKILRDDLMNNCYKKFDIELNGTKTETGKVKDFSILYNDYLSKLIFQEKCKLELNKASNAIKIDNQLTVQDALIKIRHLRQELAIYESLLYCTESKIRQYDGSGSNSYYKVKELNFDSDVILEAKEDTERVISKLEVAIQLANAQNFVDINDVIKI